MFRLKFKQINWTCVGQWINAITSPQIYLLFVYTGNIDIDVILQDVGI